MHICKWLLLGGLLVLGFRDASAQPYHGWSRITTGAALSPVIGPDEGMCVDVPGGTKSPGTAVILHPCHRGANQQFKLEDGSHDSTRISVYDGGDKRCLGYRATVEGFTLVTIDRCDAAPRWRIEQTRLHPVDLPHACLAAEPAYGFMTADLCEGRDWEAVGTQWGLSQMQLLGAARPIRSMAGDGTTCIDVRGGSRMPGASLLHYPCSGNEWQWYRLHRVDGLPGNMVMISVYQGGDMLCLANLSHEKRDATEATGCNPAQRNQLWQSDAPIGAGSVQTTFRNWETKRCLTAYQDKSRFVGTQPCDGKLDKQWRL